MKIFILEDDSERMVYFRERLLKHSITHVESCAEVAKFCPPYNVIFLDHDLGGRQMESHEDDGLQFVRLVKDRMNTDAVVVVHSYNAGGAERMLAELGEHLNVIYAPFRGDVFESIMGEIDKTVEEKEA